MFKLIFSVFSALSVAKTVTKSLDMTPNSLEYQLHVQTFRSLQIHEQEDVSSRMCAGSCARQSLWVSATDLLDHFGFTRSKLLADENKMIDIGYCAGTCTKSKSDIRMKLLKDVSLSKQLSIILPYYISKNREYLNLETLLKYFLLFEFIVTN